MYVSTCSCKVERYCVTCVIKEPVSCTIIVGNVDIHMYNISQWALPIFIVIPCMLSSYSIITPTTAPI